MEATDPNTEKPKEEEEQPKAEEPKAEGDGDAAMTDGKSSLYFNLIDFYSE